MKRAIEKLIALTCLFSLPFWLPACDPTWNKLETAIFGKKAPLPLFSGDYSTGRTAWIGGAAQGNEGP